MKVRDGFRSGSFRVSIAQSECNQPVLIIKGGSRRNRRGTIWEGIHRILGTKWICGQGLQIPPRGKQGKGPKMG